MTTTQPFPSHNLSVDVDEDKMEMATSPYPGPHATDDDIDFELEDQREHSVEDNSMIDDNTEHMESNPEHGDIMFYENEDELIDFDQDLPMDPDQGSYMQDVNEHQKDDDQLAQADTYEPSIQDASFEDAVVEEDVTNDGEDEIVGDELQEEVTNIDNYTEAFEPNDTIQQAEKNRTTDDDDEPTMAATEEHIIETQASDIKDFAPDGLSAETHHEELEQLQNEQNASHPEPTESAEASDDTAQSIEELATELDESTKAEDAIEVARDEETHESPHREASPVVLHPVSVRYNGEDCWLFTPLENTESRHVFLEDANLASEPFDRLLAALRSILVNDQEMADHDELVFDIPVLGLHICEDSKHASLMNLSRIIDIYMMLSQNEGLTVFEPLYCELSTRVCLADQFAYVDDAAFVRRITYTDFVAEQAGSPEEVAEEHSEETLEIGASVDQEEQKYADTSTYYDAADDPENEPAEEQQEQEPAPNSVEAQEIERQHTGLDDTQQPGLLDTETDATHHIPDDEYIVSHVDEVPKTTDAPTTTEADTTPVTGEGSNTLRKSSSPTMHHAEAPQAKSPKIDATESADDMTTQLAPEADEDLFADDVVEPDIEEQTTAVDDNVNNPESLPTNDDEFDWSDDEHEATKTEASPNSLATPSKGINGKRKPLDEEDDFLDLDISTPEPKRSRQS